MKGAANYFLCGMFGFLLGIVLVGTDRQALIQKSFTEGRESVLSSIVYIKGEAEGHCAISLPLTALVEMVNIGVIEWHALCEASQ